MDCSENTEKNLQMKISHFRKNVKRPIKMKFHFEVFDVLFHYFMTEQQ